GVAAVDEATVDSLVVEVPAILGDVVIPPLTVHGATAGELDRELADLAGGEPRARLPGRALIAGRAQDGDVGVQPVEVGAGRTAQERDEARVRQVPARLSRRLTPSPVRHHR